MRLREKEENSINIDKKEDNKDEPKKEEERRIKKITLLTNIINKNTSIGRYFIKWWKLLPDEIEEIVEVNGVKTKTYKKRKIKK